MEKVCPICNKLFKASNNKKKYCSYECKYGANYKSKISKIEKKCPTCGIIFDSYNIRQKYCSRSCCRRFNESGNKYNRYLSSDERLKQATNGDRRVWIMSLIKRDNNICAICKKECDLYDYEITDIGTMIAGDNYPSIDHIIPISKGGTHQWNNVQLAHRKCNRIKSNK